MSDRMKRAPQDIAGMQSLWPGDLEVERDRARSTSAHVCRAYGSELAGMIHADGRMRHRRASTSDADVCAVYRCSP